MQVDYTDLAMVSRIRVEVRGGSMEAAEKVAFLVLEHARQAGYLEGVVPDGGEWSDHFFNAPNMTRKSGEGPEPWTELGMLYAGRLAFTFQPMVASGGLRQYGYTVEPGGEHAPIPPHGEHGFIVLDRQRPVTRENSWDGLPPWQPPDGTVAETGEDVLDDIRKRPDVIEVSASMSVQRASGGVWVVGVVFDARPPVNGRGETLLDAALDALARCSEPLEGAQKVAAERIAGI
jgi:hypothetical protein